MKILQISNYYEPHIGGIEQVSKGIAEALKGDDKIEQKVFCFNHDKGDAEDEVDGVKIIRCGCQTKIASQSLSLSYGKILKKTIKNFAPDVIIFHYPNPFAAHYLLKYIPKDCKLVLYWHLDITKQKFLGKFFIAQNEKLLKRAEKIVATSPNYIEGSPYLSANRERCIVIPNRINSDGFNVSRETEEKAAAIREKDEGKIICFALGRHVPYKGMEYLVRASKLLGDNYKIYIGGEGELTGSLKSLAADDKNVDFLGRVKQDELAAYFCACDIFCFPSITKNEAFGLALAEAMSFGKPTVTFTIEGSGVNYVSLNGVTGIEVENRNVEKYAEAIKTLAEDGALRAKYGAAAKERVKELFTAATFDGNVKKLVDSL